MPGQLRLVHQVIGTIATIQRRSNTEVAPDCAAEIDEDDDECDFLVGGHYELCCCMPAEGRAEGVFDEAKPQKREEERKREKRLL